MDYLGSAGDSSMVYLGSLAWLLQLGSCAAARIYKVSSHPPETFHVASYHSVVHPGLLCGMTAGFPEEHFKTVLNA